MLRYFVAGNFWLFCTIVLLVGASEAPGSGPPAIALFGFGRAFALLYVLSGLITFGLAVMYLSAYRQTFLYANFDDHNAELKSAVKD